MKQVVVYKNNVIIEIKTSILNTQQTVGVYYMYVVFRRLQR